MKFLIIMGGYFPGQKYGGPPVSVDNFCTLMDKQECYIVTCNHDMGEDKVYPDIKTGWNDRGNCKVLYLSDKEYGYRKYEEVIREIRPDVIYLQGLFQSCIIPCLALAKKYDIPVMLAPRGELCAGAFRKKYKKIPYIACLRMAGLIRNISYQSTSQEETDAIKNYLGAESNRIHFLTNIPSIPPKKYPHTLKKSGEGDFVFISRIHPKKNLLTAIDYMKDVRGKVVFDIYGPMEDEGYWKQCEKKIHELPDNVSVNYCGLVNHDRVHETFSRYNVFLFPTLSENYGHVIIESMMVGTPVIISDQTPWTDVNEVKAGWAIPLDSREKFVEAIQKVVDQTPDEQKRQEKAVQEYIENKVHLQKIREEYAAAFAPGLFKPGLSEDLTVR